VPSSSTTCSRIAPTSASRTGGTTIIPAATYRPTSEIASSGQPRCRIIGEAASPLSEETRAGAPDVPWRAIIGMRDRIIHAYRDAYIT
jgi:uncharacterized protein with HEPN domain